MDENGFGGWSDIGFEDYDQSHRRAEDAGWSLLSWWKERRKPKEEDPQQE